MCEWRECLCWAVPGEVGWCKGLGVLSGVLSAL